MILKLNKKRKVKRKICGQEVEFIPYVDMGQKKYILDSIVESTRKRLDNDSSDFTFLVTTAYMTLDFLLLNAVTEVENSVDEYQEMVSSGLIETLHDAVTNYNDLKSSVDCVLYLCYLEKIIPSAGDLSRDLESLNDFMNNMTEEQRSNFDIISSAAIKNSNVDYISKMVNKNKEVPQK